MNLIAISNASNDRRRGDTPPESERPQFAERPQLESPRTFDLEDVLGARLLPGADALSVALWEIGFWDGRAEKTLDLLAAVCGELAGCGEGDPRRVGRLRDSLSCFVLHGLCTDESYRRELAGRVNITPKFDALRDQNFFDFDEKVTGVNALSDEQFLGLISDLFDLRRVVGEVRQLVESEQRIPED